MKIGGENCELVTSFDELRAGMIVWLTPCRAGLCVERKHRHILTRITTCRWNEIGRSMSGQAWDVLPWRSCHPDREPVIPPNAVNEGRVYRVVDPLLDAATTARKREAVRT